MTMSVRVPYTLQLDFVYVHRQVPGLYAIPFRIVGERALVHFRSMRNPADNGYASVGIRDFLDHYDYFLDLPSPEEGNGHK
jgi:hypothetical protein